MERRCARHLHGEKVHKAAQRGHLPGSEAWREGAQGICMERRCARHLHGEKVRKAPAWREGAQGSSEGTPPRVRSLKEASSSLATPALSGSAPAAAGSGPQSGPEASASSRHPSASGYSAPPCAPGRGSPRESPGSARQPARPPGTWLQRREPDKSGEGCGGRAGGNRGRKTEDRGTGAARRPGGRRRKRGRLEVGWREREREKDMFGPLNLSLQ